MPHADSANVAAVRRFNRFYTRRIGVLEEGLHATPWSLAQARILYELAHHPGVTAGDLAAGLGLDTGYLSRRPDLRERTQSGLRPQRGRYAEVSGKSVPRPGGAAAR